MACCDLSISHRAVARPTRITLDICNCRPHSRNRCGSGRKKRGVRLESILWFQETVYLNSMERFEATQKNKCLSALVLMRNEGRQREKEAEKKKRHRIWLDTARGQNESNIHYDNNEWCLVGSVTHVKIHKLLISWEIHTYQMRGGFFCGNLWLPTAVQLFCSLLCG